LKDFASEYKIKHFYDIQHCGVEHAFLPEKGLVNPLTLVIGADSHTCTYGALGAASFGVGSTDLAGTIKEGKCWFKVPETIKFVYTGELSKWLGGKDLILYTIGQIGVDGALYKVMEFSESNPKFKIKFEKSDKDAKYNKIIEIDVTKLQSQVACPHLPSNVKDADKLNKIKLNQIVIGSCTNGRISDLAIAAKILKGKKIKKGLRVVVIPATPNIYKEAESKKYLETFLKAGCLISPPTCGPCLGGHAGILDNGEICLATTNRNFIGRMGHPGSFVYLSGPAD